MDPSGKKLCAAEAFPILRFEGGDCMEHASNVLFHIGPLEVTSAVTTMWAVIAVLTLLSWLATRKLREVPGPL